MKLFNLFVGGIAAKRVTYQQVLTAHHEGTKLEYGDRAVHPNFLEYSNCPTLPVTGNIEQWDCSDENCVVICKSNSSPMPNGTNERASARLRCKKPNPNKGQAVPYWNTDVPTCETCDPINGLSEDPPLTDGNIDMTCNINFKNMKECYLTCLNGGKLNGKKKYTTKCFCNKNDPSQGCYWSNNKVEIDTSALTCDAVVTPPPNTPAPSPESCPNKDSTCTILSNDAVKYMNSWTCRNCFRIMADYKFKDQGVMNWQDEDFLDIDFRYKVKWITLSHPIDRVEDRGNNRWRLYFKDQANFNSGMMWNANIETVQKEWINDASIIRGSASCPCSNTSGAAPAPWN